jgi:hypothetical protein
MVGTYIRSRNPEPAQSQNLGNSTLYLCRSILSYNRKVGSLDLRKNQVPSNSFSQLHDDFEP